MLCAIDSINEEITKREVNMRNYDNDADDEEANKADYIVVQ